MRKTPLKSKQLRLQCRPQHHHLRRIKFHQWKNASNCRFLKSGQICALSPTLIPVMKPNTPKLSKKGSHTPKERHFREKKQSTRRRFIFLVTPLMGLGISLATTPCSITSKIWRKTIPLRCGSGGTNSNTK